jgi:hypothetical protein
MNLLDTSVVAFKEKRTPEGDLCFMVRILKAERYY